MGLSFEVEDFRKGCVPEKEFVFRSGMRIAKSFDS